MSPERGAATYCTTKILRGNLMVFIRLRLALVVSPGTLRKSVFSSENIVRATQDLGQVVMRSARGVPLINPPTLNHAFTEVVSSGCSILPKARAVSGPALLVLTKINFECDLLSERTIRPMISAFSSIVP